MYESQRQSDYTVSKNNLAEIDYQLMIDANTYTAYNSNMGDYNHTEYLAFIQAHSAQLGPSMTEKHVHQDEYEIGSDSNNSSNECLYFKDLNHSSMHQCTNGSFSNTASPSFSSALPSQQSIHYSGHPYLVHPQHSGNFSDTSVYTSLEEYASASMNPFYNDCSPSNENGSIPNVTWYNQHFEQLYGVLGEQQQLSFMQPQQRHQQQQQVLGYSHSHHGPISPSTSYTTENSSRAQIYVRKACVSCKQSHVACDVQRPCSRCVRLNKSETCVDAQRKKRGRPSGSGKKKKDENEFRRQYGQYF